MRRHWIGLLLVQIMAVAAVANQVVLSIGGSVGNFRTDTRVFNPSFDKDITVSASYWPSGNVDNSARQSVNITVPKRTMTVFDDVVQSLFGGDPSPLGAVVLESQDEIVATQRIYADESAGPQDGTLGQFVPGLRTESALTRGVLLQLKSNGARGTKGTFRTNVGMVNPNTAVANVTLKLFDKNNVQVASVPVVLQPKGVMAPTALGALFANPQGDLSNAWVSFVSDRPVFAYGSVLDNGSEDPTFITATLDTGVEPIAQMKNVTLVASDFDFSVSGTEGLKKGDTVKFTISKADGAHGLRISDPAGNVIVTATPLPNTPTDFTVTLQSSGKYFYVCTNSGCGEGHILMTGDFDVAP